MKPAERDKMRDAYLDAFRQVNRETPVPLLVYEHGWWCFFDSKIPRFPGRAPYRRTRTVDLEKMINVLRARVAA